MGSRMLLVIKCIRIRKSNWLERTTDGSMVGTEEVQLWDLQDGLKGVRLKVNIRTWEDGRHDQRKGTGRGWRGVLDQGLCCWGGDCNRDLKTQRMLHNVKLISIMTRKSMWSVPYWEGTVLKCTVLKDTKNTFS